MDPNRRTSNLFGKLARVGALVLASASASAGPTTTVDLASAAIEPALTGKGPPGMWSVIDDADAATGRALAQTSTDRTSYRFPLAITNLPALRDLVVTMRFKPVSGSVDQAGGIAIRLQDANNYYVLRANALENNVRFYRVVNGDRRQIAGINISVAPGVWHSLTLRAEGDRFTVLMDGAPLFTATDRTFSGAGRTALWTKADSITHFDQLIVETLP